MPFVHATGADVHYVERGQGVHTTVLLHGFSPYHRLMTGCFEPVFAKRNGWRRVCLDLPGMGLTNAPEDLVGTDAVSAVVRAAIDALVPGRYTVAGGSYGGYLARGLVAAEPDRVSGMALVCPVIGMERDVDERVVLVSEVEDFSEIAVVLTEETRRRQAEERSTPVSRRPTRRRWSGSVRTTGARSRWNRGRTRGRRCSSPAGRIT